MNATTLTAPTRTRKPRACKSTTAKVAEPKRLTLKDCRYSLDFQRKYRTTATSCECPAASFNSGQLCKHALIVRLAKVISAHVRQHMACVARAGGSPRQGRLDIYYSHLAHHLARFNATGERVDGLAVVYLTRTITRWERHARRDVSAPIEQRLAAWQATKAAGQTTLKG